MGVINKEKALKPGRYRKLMKKTISWKKVPQYTTNLDLFSEPPNYVVFIRIKDFTYDKTEGNSLNELNEKFSRNEKIIKT